MPRPSSDQTRTGNPTIQVRVAVDHPVRGWLVDRAQRMMSPALASQGLTEWGLLKGLLEAELTRQEWTLPELALLAHVSNGSILTAHYSTGRLPMLAASVYDATYDAMDHHAAHFGAHPQAVIDKLAALGPTAAHALEDALSRWWATQAEHDDAHTVEGWARVGVRVTPEPR